MPEWNMFVILRVRWLREHDWFYCVLSFTIQMCLVYEEGSLRQHLIWLGAIPLISCDSQSCFREVETVGKQTFWNVPDRVNPLDSLVGIDF